MDNEKKRELKAQYAQRHPDMGIICWRCRDRLWVDMSRDAKADYNGSSFQLKLGSWPNKEMAEAYKADPDSMEFSLIRRLDYEDYSEDHTDDLKLLLMEFLEEHPEAKPMRIRFNL